jgi:hypothetical protein
MVAKEMICSSNPEATQILTPTWDQIEEALDRLDDSIWLEGEGDQQLSVTRVDLVQMGHSPADDPNADRWGWIVLARYQGGNTNLLALYQDTNYLPADIAKAAIRNWLEQNPCSTSPPPVAGSALKWVW